jgi:cytochrome c553
MNSAHAPRLPEEFYEMIRNWLVAALLAWPALALAQTAAAPAAAVDAGKIVSTVCVACHNNDGHSIIPMYPNIGGQPAAYIATQLAHFKSGVRPGTVMPGFAATLSDADMAALGAYFAEQPPKLSASSNPALVQAGQQIFRAGVASANVPACAGCHAPDGAGMPKNYPRVGGQWADYTYAQLKAFASGERGNDKDGKDVNGRIMTAIASKLTDAQMQAVAQYMQALR